MAVKFIVFPFAISGDRGTVPDPSQISGTVSWQTGFPIGYSLDPLTNPAGFYVPRLQFNQVTYDLSNAVNQYQTHGVPDFITTSDNLGTPYPYDIYARVRYNAGSGYAVYENQVQGNTTLPSDPSWIVVSSSILPPGIIFDYAGGSVLAGFLLCDGSDVSRTTYAALFGAIGVLWGVGDGSTTFNLPDFRRRVAMGSGGTASGTIPPGISNTTGSYGGEEAHPLTGGENGPHNHGGSTVGTVPGNNVGSSQSVNANQGNVGPTIEVSCVVVATDGAGTPHNTIQPSAIVTKMIKY